MWIWGIFFLLIGSEILIFKSSDALQFKSLIKTENESKTESNDTLPYQQVRYDKDGILCINGTFPGITEPIVVDKKAIPKHCAYKPFYVLSVCPAIKQLLINRNITCPEGDLKTLIFDQTMTKYKPIDLSWRDLSVVDYSIIFCYDGQLNNLYVLEQFVLPFNENEEITQKCKNMNGFKIALHYLPWMKKKRNADKDFGDFFMEIKTSYMTESYYFPLPHSNCMDLSLGNPDNLLTGVRSMENDNNLVMPVQVDLHDNLTMVGIGYRSDLNEDDPNQSIRKKFIEDFTTLPDYMRMEKYSDKPHLKMLYLDFRAQPLVPQMMRAIIPESKSTCNMMIRVRGNTIQECKAEFRQKNYALRSFKNNQTITKYGLTVESGIEEWGQKTTTSKGSLFSTERGGSSTDESTSLTGLQRENENVESFTNTKVDEKGETDKTNFDGSVGLGLGVKKGGFTGNIGGEYRWGWEQTNSFLERSERMNSLTTAHSFSETTSTSKSLILENAYRHTSTSIDNQQQSRIQSNTVGVTKRTVFKWLMTVPPGKVLTPMQMQMDCDGTNVKIPWIKFVLTDEEASLPVQDYN